MKKKYTLSLLVVLMSIFVLFSVSCGNGDEKYTGIETPNLSYKDGAYNLLVSSDVKAFDLTSIFSISENATFVISKNESFNELIDSNVELEVGANSFFVKVTDNKKNEAIYKFIITKKQTYNVTFNVNGGSQVATIQCEEGQIIEAPVSLKPGYTLSWDYDFSKPIIKDTNITATWVANEYKIIIDGLNDTIVNVKFGESYELTAPTKTGYVFTGWQLNGSAFDATIPYNIDGDITVVPKYEIEQYTINYITIGGTNNNPNTYTVEDEIVFEELVWLSNDETLVYEFDGWYKDAEYTEPFGKIEKGTTGNIDVYGKWIITKIPEKKVETTVTFVAPGFDCDGKTEVIAVGDNYTLPSLTKDGYILNGWVSSDGRLVLPGSGEWAIDEEAITIEPFWVARTYSINYVLNGGINNENNLSTYTILSVPTLAAPTKQYSAFDGWYKDEGFTQRVEQIPEGSFGDITLYAKWNERKFTITYDANNGEITQDTQTVVLGQKYSLINPVRNGYEFKGWFKGEDTEPFNAEGDWLIEENVELKAKWEIITYEITYELDGGESDNLVFTYTVETSNFLLPTPVKEGKLFLGWSLNDGQINNKTVVLKGSTGNRVYEANWCDSQDSSGFMYSIVNNEALVVGYHGVIGANVSIPAEYNGYPVTAIANRAFLGYGKKLAELNSSGSFTTILIPTTITRIGTDAFGDCDDLKVLINDADEKEVNAWVEKVVVENGNKHLIDVIMGKRPAIGWKIYYKP